MKYKVLKSLVYSGQVYNPGEVVDILETEVIDRCKNLELIEETEEVFEELKEDDKKEPKKGSKTKNGKSS